MTFVSIYFPILYLPTRPHPAVAHFTLQEPYIRPDMIRPHPICADALSRSIDGSIILLSTLGFTFTLNLH